MSESAIGDVLRAARLLSQLTLAQAGERLGYSTSALSRIETGQRTLTVDELRLFAGFYGIREAKLGLATVGAAATSADGGDDVLRRQLLAGVLGVAGATLLGSPRASAGSATAQPVTVAVLRRMVDGAQADYLACRYTQLAESLPRLVRSAETAYAAADPERRCEVNALRSTAHRLATWLALRVGEDGLATGECEKALAAARESGDLLAEAEAAQMGAVVLRRFAELAPARELVVGTAGKLADDGLSNPACGAACAMLLETGAYTAAVAGDRSTALDLHAEAASAARLTHGHLPAATLTPSVVDVRHLDLYTVSVHRKLGDYGTAIQAARAIRPATIGVTERRVRYWEDVALAYEAWGKRREAYQALRAADHAAPQEILYRPWAKGLIGRLRHTGPPLPGLTEFAARAGIT